MRKIISFLLILSSFLFLSIIGCKKDCKIEPPPDDSIPDTTVNCHPLYHYLTSNELSFYEFILQTDSIRYYKTNNGTYLFDGNSILVDTAGGCTDQYEYYSTTFFSESDLFTRYTLNPYVVMNFPQNFLIRIGIPGCLSYFYISTGSDTVNVDSVQLLDKTFYDVYYRTEQLSCASEMYYNKQYGVVGFNWLGQWYVLETDSL